MSALHPLEFERPALAFDPRLVPVHRFDLLVVGGGVAGASAALAAAQQGASVAVLAKGTLAESNTLYAQGGIAAALGPDDSVASHVQDTLEVGCGLCEVEVVERVVRGARSSVERLLRWGAQIDRDGQGDLALSREGGHSHARILHARGDATGMEIQRSMLAALGSHPSITCFEDTFVADLLGESTLGIRGALAIRGNTSVAFAARQVVLATGGGGQLFRETTNPSIATGDGVALGFRSGAVVRDLEFFQFHPTCLYIAGAARVLISEIVRGAGGVLRDRNGTRFMPDYHPDAELAPRDVVSRAVFERMVATDDTNVYLDFSAIRGNPHELFPGISKVCSFFGIDIARDPVPVRPGAHYMVGGLEVDAEGRTAVPGLWAVGECASSGLHGANRMGSNSLLEGLVLGEAAGTAAALELAGRPEAGFPEQVRAPALRRETLDVRISLEDVTYSLKSLMWRQMGVKRDARMLEDALGKIRLWTRAVSAVGAADVRGLELLNMLSVARLAILGALSRQESRGVHFRIDHPSPRPEWRQHTLLTPVFEAERLVAARLSLQPVAGAPVRSAQIAAPARA